MKKSILLVSILLMVFSLVKVEATIESGFLPGGKNYLDYHNFRVDTDTLESIDSIRVKPNTTYTITIPNGDLIGEAYVYIHGTNVYMDDYVNVDSKCQEVDDTYVCTFDILQDDYIDIYIESSMIGLFDSYYQFDIYQLEEGSSSTAYEAYIAPIHDVTSPEFNNTGAFITSYQETTPLVDIVSNHVYAFDEVDGDVSSSIVIVEDNYSSFIGTIGNYDCKIKASDSSGNVSYFDLVIIVKDEIAPIITGSNTIDVDVNDLEMIDAIISSNFSITDDYDGALPYTILSDDYTVNKGVLGSYTVSFKVVDSSLNETSKTFTVNVNDYDAPILESSSMYATPVSSLESLEDIVNGLIFTDNYGTITKEIVSENYVSNEQNVGTYFVDVLVRDESLNEATYTITITVQDDVLPSITGVENVSYSYITPPTLEEVKALLSVSDNHDVLSIDDIYVIDETYLSRTDNVGSYYITFEVSDAASNNVTHTIYIDLVDDQSVFHNRWPAKDDVGKATRFDQPKVRSGWIRSATYR